MRKGSKGVTYDDVCEACTILIAEGRTATQANIREILGTGSFSTIAKHLNKWKEVQQQNNEEEEEISDTPSDDRPVELETLSAELWLKAKHDAEAKNDERLAAIQAKADKEIAEAHDREADAIQMMKRALAQTSMAEQLNKELQEQLATQTKEYTRELELLKHRNRLIEIRAEEKHEQFEELKLDLEDAERERNDALSKLNALKEQYSTQLAELTESSQANLNREQQRSIGTENRLLKQIDELRLSIKALEDERQILSQAVLDAREQSREDIKAVTTQFSEIASLIRESYQGNAGQIAELKKQAHRLGEEVLHQSTEMKQEVSALAERLASFEGCWPACKALENE